MNNVIYYPHFYPSENWLKLASLCWDRVYTMQLDESAQLPESISKVNEVLGGVLYSAQPWEQIVTRSETTTQGTSKSRRDPALNMSVHPMRRITSQTPTSLRDVASWEETAQQF